MYFGVLAWLVVAGRCGAERWAWPEPEPRGAASVRIDSKVRFVDSSPDRDSQDNRNVQADEVPFRAPSDTAGFYNRPPGEGRYPVRSQRYRAPVPARFTGQNSAGGHVSDGTLDSLQYCECVSSPRCQSSANHQHSCGANEYLCCYAAPNQQNSEFFNEIDDERPALLPGHTAHEGPFPPPPGRGPTDRRQAPVLAGPGGPTGDIGPPGSQVLVGPGGPTGLLGPSRKPNVLVGPDGPTGIIGPGNVNRNPGVSAGPDGENDIRQSASAQRGVLVGPGGPTGIIGPQYNRPVLVGPGGPTGIIGPRQQGGFGSRRGILSGPGGPTGIVGPGGFNQRRNPGVLVGPGGPTGIIGPGRQILVGPGGPTGRIGPDFGK